MSQLLRIIVESVSVFYKDAQTGRINWNAGRVVVYCLFPLLISVFSIMQGFVLGDGLNKAVVGFLSLFIVLAFQVIFIATDKFSVRVNEKIMERRGELGPNLPIVLYEDEKNYLKRMGNYTKQFVRVLFLVLLVCLLIMILSVIELFSEVSKVKIVCSAFILAYSYLWLILLLKLIVGIYKLLLDDINHKMTLVV